MSSCGFDSVKVKSSPIVGFATSTYLFTKSSSSPNVTNMCLVISSCECIKSIMPLMALSVSWPSCDMAWLSTLKMKWGAILLRVFAILRFTISSCLSTFLLRRNNIHANKAKAASKTPPMIMVKMSLFLSMTAFFSSMRNWLCSVSVSMVSLVMISDARMCSLLLSSESFLFVYLWW